MTDVIAHRGPDGEGFFVDDFVALGHRRLAIIDVAAGQQPMGVLDGQVQIVFNTTEGWQSHKDSASIRASSVANKIPYFTTAASSAAVARAIAVLTEGGLEVRSLQDYYSRS